MKISRKNISHTRSRPRSLFAFTMDLPDPEHHWDPSQHQTGLDELEPGPSLAVEHRRMTTRTVRPGKIFDSGTVFVLFPHECHHVETCFLLIIYDS